jgi:hypothetical protein
VCVVCVNITPATDMTTLQFARFAYLCMHVCMYVCMYVCANILLSIVKQTKHTKTHTKTHKTHTQKAQIHTKHTRKHMQKQTSAHAHTYTGMRERAPDDWRTYTQTEGENSAELDTLDGPKDGDDEGAGGWLAGKDGFGRAGSGGSLWGDSSDGEAEMDQVYICVAL